jgi:hypothetical protein
MTAIKAKNVTAQLHYRATGNAPGTHPETAVGNFFPGLEFNFQNVWKRIFVGIDLVEYGGQVLAVHRDEFVANGGQIPDGFDFDGLVNAFIESIDGVPLYRDVILPPDPNNPPDPNSTTQIFLEWSNALASLHAKKGGTDQTATCFFTIAGRAGPDTRVGPLNLKVRRLIEPDSALISRLTSLPGEITESLCSPWQTDYIGCACYYWASNRPDYVNIEQVSIENADKSTRTETTGNNWLNLSRITDDADRPRYTLKEENLLQHVDVMQGWEHKFHFVIKGRDAPDGLASTKKTRK